LPFTPFHLGPALVLGLPLRRNMHVPTFVIANIILDVEPFLVLLLGLKYPLHGYLHTFVGAIVTGVALGYIMYTANRHLRFLWEKLFPEPVAGLDLKAFMVASVSGTLLHVLMDSPLYYDIKPLYPLLINPLYNPSLLSLEYRVCIFTGIIGLTYYLYLMTKNPHLE